MDWKSDQEFSIEQGRPRPYERAVRILNASIPLFRVWGVRVRLHWSFFLVALAFWGWTARAAAAGAPGTGTLFLWGMVQATILYSLVLLHEFGHAGAAAARGRPAREILLTPLGGTAIIDRAMASPAMEAEVSLAGPGVNLLILGVSVAAVAGSGLPEPWAGPLTFTGALRFAFWANLMLALFNLAPAYPLDGGRVLRAILSWRIGERRGTRLACRAGEVAGVVFLGAGIWRGGTFGWILAGIGIMNVIACEATIRAVALGLPVYEDPVAELGVAPGEPRETREEKRARRTAELEQRLDELLEKVSRQGMSSLTLGERLFLRRASRHFRGRQDSKRGRD